MPAGLGLNYGIRKHDGQAELYIDADQESGEGNTAIFNQILAHKEEIERDFGGSLEWESLDSKRACRIRKIISAGGWQDEDKWPEAHDNMVDAMIRLEKALRPHLDNL